MSGFLLEPGRNNSQLSPLLLSSERPQFSRLNPQRSALLLFEGALSKKPPRSETASRATWAPSLLRRENRPESTEWAIRRKENPEGSFSHLRPRYEAAGSPFQESWEQNPKRVLSKASPASRNRADSTSRPAPREALKFAWASRRRGCLRRSWARSGQGKGPLVAPSESPWRAARREHRAHNAR